MPMLMPTQGEPLAARVRSQLDIEEL